MNGLPEPYENDTHVTVHGRVFAVIDHAPNGDSWRYHGIPADLQGDTVTFSHEEATPVHTRAPRPVGEVLPDVVQELLAVERPRPHTPLGDLLETIAESIRRGIASPDVREAYIVYQESGPQRA